MSIHTLTDSEMQLSEHYSNLCGHHLAIYHDGDWICNTYTNDKDFGWGETASEAYEHFLSVNNIERA